ncbi:hypothetical protein BGX27_010177 [Mortierella sp. AM989]|nr:hypothetical protein BGX27_010177 [Mortierella sp. AM989]
MNAPFNIPLIVDLIGQYLSQDDYACCTLVNKAFRQQFKRLLWRKIRKSHSSGRGSSIPLTADHQKALLDNGYLVRNLELEETRHGRILRFLASSNSICKSLLIFDCKVLEHFICYNLFEQVMDVIERSTVLKRCTIKGVMGNNTMKSNTTRFFNILANHPSLTALNLLDYAGMHHTTYRSLLQHLPKTLQTLAIQWCIRIKNTSEPDDSAESDWPSDYPYLRSISLSLVLRGYEESTIIPFLQRCSNLEELEVIVDRDSVARKLPTILWDAQQFPILTRLRLGGMRIEESEWKATVAGMQGRIRSFSTSSVEINQALNYPDTLFATQWADTLEVIRLQGTNVSSHEIQQILTSCSNLKTFSVSTAFRKPALPLSCSSGVDVKWNIDKADWVCVDLENLEMPFLDFRQIFEPDYIMSYPQIESTILLQETHNADGIRKVYQQLGRLTKLQYLRIGWRSSTKSNLDMSIGSGMDQMVDLKELRVLDVGCIPHDNIREPEIKWITRHWPRLHTIRGLLVKEFAGPSPYNKAEDFEKVKDEIVPHYIQWLQKQKPNILVT